METMDIDESVSQPSTSSKREETISKKHCNLLWIEKYRPQTFQEIVGNDDTLTRLSIFSKARLVGKTTTI
ncbi:hypothetical protein JTB14_014541 [Gonioctena quinquepunctata]|nr:hypothetical protein JTB14_014541 [Gonioctena quinquepunctata]